MPWSPRREVRSFLRFKMGMAKVKQLIGYQLAVESGFDIPRGAMDEKRGI